LSRGSPDGSGFLSFLEIVRESSVTALILISCAAIIDKKPVREAFCRSEETLF
jgi:hypothetical protein